MLLKRKIQMQLKTLLDKLQVIGGRSVIKLKSKWAGIFEISP